MACRPIWGEGSDCKVMVPRRPSKPPPPERRKPKVVGLLFGRKPVEELSLDDLSKELEAAFETEGPVLAERDVEPDAPKAAPNSIARRLTIEPLMTTAADLLAKEPQSAIRSPWIPKLQKSFVELGGLPAPDIEEEETPRGGSFAPDTLAVTTLGTSGHLEAFSPTEEKLVSVFSRLSDDGQIHQDQLLQALELSGIRCPVQDWIDQIVKNMTRFTTLDEDEFIRLVKLYLDQQTKEYENAFHEFDSDGSGTIEADELAKLLQWLGITPMEQVIRDIILEVDPTQKGELDLTGFCSVVALLGERDGFGKAEYERMKNTFDVFDADKTQSLDTEELVAMLSYMAYCMSPETVQKLLNEVDVDCSGTLSFQEYLIFMRKLREMEINRITEVLASSGDDMQDLLHSLLQSVGYIAEREAVLDAALECGISVSAAPRRDDPEALVPRGGSFKEPLLSLSDAYRFLQVYRMREGFTRAEATDLEATFMSYAEQAPGTDIYRISCFDAGRALTWLGYRCPYEAYQLLFTEVDMGGAGSLGFSQFLKLVRMHRAREVEEIRASLLRLGAAELEADVHSLPNVMASSSLRRSIDFLSTEGEERRGTMGGRIGSVRGQLFSRRARSQRHDEYGMIRSALQQRAKIRASCQENAGFTPADVVSLRHRFEQYDTNGDGDISQSELRLLCQDLLPAVASDAKSRPELLRILQDVDASLEGHLSFADFLKLMRNLDDSKKKARQTKEKRTTEQLEFTKLQIREFREVFVANDPEGKGTITYAHVQKLLGSVVPLGHRRVQMLREIWQRQHDMDGSAESSDMEDWTTDFSDFLRLMQQLLDIDFAGIKQRSSQIAETMSAKQATQRQQKRSRPSVVPKPDTIENTFRRQVTKSSLTRSSFLKIVQEDQEEQNEEEAPDESWPLQSSSDQLPFAL